jgi:hypothetical protein
MSERHLKKKWREKYKWRHTPYSPISPVRRGLSIKINKDIFRILDGLWKGKENEKVIEQENQSKNIMEKNSPFFKSFHKFYIKMK